MAMKDKTDCCRKGVDRAKQEIGGRFLKQSWAEQHLDGI